MYFSRGRTIRTFIIRLPHIFFLLSSVMISYKFFTVMGCVLFGSRCISGGLNLESRSYSVMKSFMHGLHSRQDSTRQDENGSVKGTFVSSRSSRRHVDKSVSIQRKQECLKCLASLSTILARECECLHSCILRLVHISLKVLTST